MRSVDEQGDRVQRGGRHGRRGELALGGPPSRRVALLRLIGSDNGLSKLFRATCRAANPRCVVRREQHRTY
ncbi:hypothetical protein GCM10009540_29100 [Streptomyces turgidiscabies]